MTAPDPIAIALRLLQERAAPTPYVDDPVTWVAQRTGEHLWSKQREIAASVVANKRTAVKASHAVGKSFLAARLIAWWMDVHPPGEAFVVSTAPTFRQVQAVLWREVGKAFRKAAANGYTLPGRLNQTEWLIGSELVGYGRKPADQDEHGFQGIHARYVLVILDEACGIPRQLWTAVEAITTGPDCRILAIGNPDDPATEFGEVCKRPGLWNIITVPAASTPNFTGEAVPAYMRPLLVEPQWAADLKTSRGETSPEYTSKVLAEFPDSSSDTLIPYGWIERARERDLIPGPTVELGVDVARYGTDESVIYRRQGPVARLLGTFGQQPTTETTGRVIAALRETGASLAKVDGVGVGGGVVDQLAELGYPVADMQAGARPNDPDTFVNARAEWYWGLRQRFEVGDIDIDPDDAELAAQLAQIKYKYTSRGQLQIESKDDMKKRGLSSPDRADALMLAFAPIFANEVVYEDVMDDDYLRALI